MTKIIAFKVSDAEYNRIWKEATKVPGRTMTAWAKPLILAAVTPPKPRPPRLPQPSDQ